MGRNYQHIWTYKMKQQTNTILYTRDFFFDVLIIDMDLYWVLLDETNTDT